MAQCIEKGKQEDNFVYSVNEVDMHQTFLTSVVTSLCNCLNRHISTFRKEELEKSSDENVLLLTHCASIRQNRELREKRG